MIPRFKRTLLGSTWMALLVLEPFTLRTSKAFLGLSSFRYMLFTDFVFLALTAALILGGDFTPFKIHGFARIRRIQLTLGLLFVLRYASILLSSLGGGAFWMYIFSGSVWIQIMVVLLVGQSMVTSEREAVMVRRCFLLGSAIVGLIGLLELFRIPAVIGFLNVNYGTEFQVAAAVHAEALDQFRLTSTFDRNPHGFAIQLMMTITVLTAMLVVERERPLIQRAFLIGALGLATVLLLGTFSSLALGGTILSIITVILSRKRGLLFLIAALLVAASSLVIYLPQIMSSSSGGTLVALFRLLSGGGGDGPGSFTDRWEVWKLGFHLLKSSPENILFGIPLERITEEFDRAGISADSDFLNILIYQGVVGLGAFLAFCGFVFWGLQTGLKNLAAGNPEQEILLLSGRGILLGMVVAGFAGGFLVGGGTAWRTGFMVFSLLGAALGIDPSGERA